MIDCTDAFKRFTERNDADAFRELVSTYHPMVYGVCRRVLGSHRACEDATHETFIKLSRHAHAIRGNLGSWLYTCALNISRGARQSELARRRRERDASESWREQEKPGFDDDEYALLNLCIAELNDVDRDIISQYFFIGLSQHEIAARTGLSQVGIKKRIDRALRALRYRMICHGFDLGPINESASGRLRQVGGIALPALLGAGISPDALVLSWCASNPKSTWEWLHTLGRRIAESVHGLVMTTSERLSGRAGSIYKSTRRPFRLNDYFERARERAGDSAARLIASCALAKVR